MNALKKNDTHYIVIEVTKLTYKTYREFNINCMFREESVNGHYDILLTGDFKDLKAFCLSEHYTTGDAEADLEFFNENIKK